MTQDQVWTPVPCDTCGEMISSIEDGWLEWWLGPVGSDEAKSFGFRLVHHITASPKGRADGCYQVATRGLVRPAFAENCIEQHHHLRAFVGPEGLARLLDVLTERNADRISWARIVGLLHAAGIWPAEYEHSRRVDDAIAREGQRIG